MCSVFVNEPLAAVKGCNTDKAMGELWQSFQNAWKCTCKCTAHLWHPFLLACPFPEIKFGVHLLQVPLILLSINMSFCLLGDHWRCNSCTNLYILYLPCVQLYTKPLLTSAAGVIHNRSTFIQVRSRLYAHLFSCSSAPLHNRDYKACQPLLTAVFWLTNFKLIKTHH